MVSEHWHSPIWAITLRCTKDGWILSLISVLKTVLQITSKCHFLHCWLKLGLFLWWICPTVLQSGTWNKHRNTHKISNLAFTGCFWCKWSRIRLKIANFAKIIPKQNCLKSSYIDTTYLDKSTSISFSNSPQNPITSPSNSCLPKIVSLTLEQQEPVLMAYQLVLRAPRSSLASHRRAAGEFWPISGELSKPQFSTWRIVLGSPLMSL